MEMMTELEFENNEANGPATWWRGRLIFWRHSMSRSAISLQKLKKIIAHVLRIIVVIVIVIGWLSLLAWMFFHWQELSMAPIKLLLFWENRDPLILVFLLSLWFDLFLVYRRSEEMIAKIKIDHRKWREDYKHSDDSYNAAGAASEYLEKVLADAFLLASKLKQSEVSVMHFFRALLTDVQVQNVFVRLNVSASSLVDKIERHLLDLKVLEKKPYLSDELREVLILAFIDSVQRQQEGVKPLNALIFCYQRSPVLAEILYDLDIDADKINNVCEWFHINRKLVLNYQSYRRSAILKPGSGMDRAYTAIATPTLDNFSHDLTLAAKYGRLELCVGRKKEIDSIFETIESGQGGILLVGASGTGKTMVINGIAQLMVAEQVPKFLQDKRLVEIDVSRLVSGASPAEAEARLLACINESARSKNIILHIANIENLVGISAGGEDSLDLSEVLSEALSRDRVICLATITSNNYTRVVEKTALGESMTTIGISEPNINQAIQILESKVGLMEGKYKIFITYDAIEQAVILSDKYLHDKFMPAKALDLLQRAVTLSAKASRHNPKNSICSKEQVALAISEMTGIPAQKLTESESHKLLSLEENIHHRMVGQEEAVTAVSSSLRRARAELKDAKRPIASFLFLGPTGVGKTELAKTVSEVYFGDEDYMVRLDMSEYQAADSIRKMIGDVDGTLGYLTEAVRKKPFSLILLDEIEKAHPDILNLFLQLLDDGRLTDGQGRTISFTESIIIATSNIGALYIQEQIKASTDLNLLKQELIDNQLNKFMRPELINRFDGIIVFKPLTKDNIFQIATLMLKGIKKRLSKKGVGLKADRKGVQKLALAGYDPKFGARPLRRLLQDRVEDKVANKILAGELKRRDTVVIGPNAEISVIKGREL
ncbi:MAG: ATP-dependent Clp protease ATP-binding subunit [Patescibacteria group bacterium]|nr:ATP-dependent Clp protease ATP-binding subunit [Patescibacteria group bacterium]